MTNFIENQIARQIEKFKSSFLQVEKLPFNDFFPIETIEAIIKNTPQKRTSVFTPLITLKAFIFQVLSDDGSCRKAVSGVLIDLWPKGNQVIQLDKMRT